jgi:DNA-binding MarR family transcriptional regulator
MLPSAEELSAADALRAFKVAMRFRRRTNRALRALGISFAQWRVLEAAARLIRRTDDAVSHLDVSQELDLDEASVSRLMHILSERGWVDHGPDLRFYAWRVFMTDAG